MSHRIWIVIPWLVGACGAQLDGEPLEDHAGAAEGALSNPLPPSPRLPIDIIAKEAGIPTHTHLPVDRASFDGRVTVGAFCDPADHVAKFRFGTFAPEAYLAPISGVTQNPPPRPTLTLPTGIAKRITHTSVCDAGKNGRRQPYACGSDDCYEFNVIASVQDGDPCTPEISTERQLWSIPVRVRVAQPKTADAHVESAELIGTITKSPTLNSHVLEHVVSGDGHLVVFHDAGYEGVQYAVHRHGEEACDAGGWQPMIAGARPKPFHLSHLYRDPAAAAYGLSRYPLRNTLNQVIADNAKVFGSYLWLDRKANNLFFMQSGVAPFYVEGGAVHARQPLPDGTPLPDLATIDASTDGQGRVGLSWVGLWSRGKMVTVDNRLENADWGIKEGYGYAFKLYADHPEGTLIKRSANLTISSIENQHNWLEPMLPDSPRDVAWQVTNDFATDEVAFDDQLDDRALVVSTMNAAVDNANRGFYDGNLRTFDPSFAGSTLVSTEIRVENAAASLSKPAYDALVAAGLGARVPAGNVQWNVPGFGLVKGGARIEPIAAGGVRGKGLYLDGADDRVEYTIGAQPIAFGADWTFSLWIDARPGASYPARILTTPDGTALTASDAATLRYQIGSDATSAVSIALPQPLSLGSGWHHLAIVTRADNRVELYVDGLRLHRLAASRHYFGMAPGKLVLGSFLTSTGVMRRGLPGWFDEFKALGRVPGFEELCNHAHGTIVGDTWGDARSALYPAATHADLSTELASHHQSTAPRYFCEIGLDDNPFAMCIGKTHRRSGVGPQCLHAALQFPEGPLHATAPRPDSRGNAFCQSCHLASNPTASLKPAALQPGSVAEMNDERRQPLQPPAILYGVYPPGGADHSLDSLIYP